MNATRPVDRVRPAPAIEPELPYLMPSATVGTTATAFLAVARDTIRQRLHEYGAVLLRGFEVGGADGFGRVVRAVSGAPLAAWSSPPDEEVFPRNESAGRTNWPRTLFVHCVRPPRRDGAALLADTRQVLRLIDPEVRAEAVRRGWSAAGRAAVHRHPVTGEAVWFNDLALGGGCYGDGERVPGPVVAHLRDCYRAAQRRFAWRAGDLLLVDNMLVALGHAPGAGPAEFAVAAAA